MFEQADRMSAAQADARRAGRIDETLMPALAGCEDCNVTQIITAPTLGTCPGCGHTMHVLDGRVTAPAALA